MDIATQIGTVPQLNQTIAAIRLKAPAKAKVTRHTLLLLDCSGSMAGSLPQVRQDAAKYVAEMDGEDFVSVLIFSGHGRAKVIAGPTQTNDKGRKMVGKAIASEVKVLDVTVFSEPLALALGTVKKLTDADTVHNAVLFTDGCAVPDKWDVKTEQNKACDVATQLVLAGAAVSVIGYGVYYDDAFIKQLMEAGGNSGMFKHISEIDEFGPAVTAINEAFKRAVPMDAKLKFVNGGKVGRVFRMLPELALVGTEGKANLTSAYEGDLTLFVELADGAKELKVTGTVDGQPISENLKVEPLSKDNGADFIRCLGAYAFLKGDTATTQKMLALTGDEALADKVGSAYTDRERRETGDVMREMFANRRFIGSGLKPTGPNNNVLNVLRVLIEDPANVVYIPKGAYKRSGELTSDPRIVQSPLGRSLQVMGYVSNEERFNFSLRCLKDVKVLPEDLKGPPTDMKVWRSYNVILDGNLHLPELEASLSEVSFVKLQDAGVIKEGEAWTAGKVYMLNLRDMKMVSSAWTNPKTLGLVGLLRKEVDLKSEQSALNARRKATQPSGSSGGDGGEFIVYTETSAKVDGIPTESYEARCVDLRLVGYKPKEYDCAAMTHEQADARVRQVRQELTTTRYLIRAIVFAMDTTGSKMIPWDAGKTVKRGKHSKLEQTVTFDGAQLKKVSWDESFVCS